MQEEQRRQLQKGTEETLTERQGQNTKTSGKETHTSKNQDQGRLHKRGHSTTIKIRRAAKNNMSRKVTRGKTTTDKTSTKAPQQSTARTQGNETTTGVKVA